MRIQPSDVMKQALPLVSAIGYAAFFTGLLIRVGHDDGDGVKVMRCSLSIIAASVATATVTTGVKAAKEFFANQCDEAKKTILHSLRSGGFIRNVAWPSRELELLGKAAVELDAAQAMGPEVALGIADRI